MLKSRSNSVLILLTLIVLAVCLRLINIGLSDIGTDEVFSIYIAQLPISKIVDVLAQGDNPPLWEILVHQIDRFFGTNVNTIRYISFIFSVLTLIPLYYLGEYFIGKYAGLVASSLFIFSDFALFIAQEARVYALLGLLCCFSIVLFLKALQQPYKTINWLFLAVINSLIFYSHYLGTWIIVIEVLYWLLNHLRDKKRRWFIYSLALTLLLTLPQFPTLLNRFLESGTAGTWIPKTSSISDLYYMILKFSNEPVIAIVLIVLCLIPLVNGLKGEISIFVLWFWIPLVGSFLLSFKIGFFLDRYLYFILPGVYLLVAEGLFIIKQRIENSNLAYSPMLILIAAFAFTYSFNSQSLRFSGYHKKIRPISTAINKHLTVPQSSVVISPLWFDKEIVYHSYPEMFNTYFGEVDSTSFFKKPLRKKDIQVIEYADEMELDRYKSILFIDDYSLSSIPDNGILDRLDKNYTLRNQAEISGRKLYYYTK